MKSFSSCPKMSPSLTLTAFLMLAMLVLPVNTSEEASAYTPHNPILIEGDWNFTSENGVVSGSGTWSDPYVIEGWEVDNLRNYSSAIELRNTSAHFIIRDSHFIGTASYPWASSGISLQNVTNGRIENTTSEGYHAIRIEDSENNTIENNNVSLALYGLYVSHSMHSTIIGNRVRGPLGGTYCGMHIQFSHVTDMANNSFEMTQHSICIVNSANTTISHSEFSNVANAIRIEFSNNTVIMNNTLTAIHQHGVYIYHSKDTVIANNTIDTSHTYGVYLYHSDNATLLGNIFVSSGIFMEGTLVSHYNSHTIGSDNLVNGLPVRYFKDCFDRSISGEAIGQLLVSNCMNVTISNLHIEDTDAGIEMAFVGNALVENNTLLGNWYGLYFYGSSNLTVVENSLSANKAHGGVLSSSTDILFGQNTISSNGRQGIRIIGSENVTLVENEIRSNVRDAIFLGQSLRSSIRGNRISGNGYGVYLSMSTDNLVVGNLISSNGNGTYLLDSTDNTIRSNNITDNSLGIYLGTSEGNSVIHNNISYNGIQAIDYTIGGNRWDDAYPSGGNYWSDYVGSDNFSGPNQDQPGSDGMGDTSYVVDMDSLDRYPLIVPRHDFSPPKIVQTFINGKETQTYSIESVPGLNLAATIDDRDTGGSWIGGANYTLGLLSWSSSNVMSAQDGAFDSDWEEVFANLSPLTEVGSYSYCVYAWDIQGNLNATSTACAELNILSPPLRPLIVSAVLSGPDLEDVTVSWNRSGDDGTGENDIERYDIYRSTSYTGPYELVANVTANGSQVYEWTCLGCGNADPNSYFFHVEAYDGVLSSASPREAAKFTRTLSQGPNLVSIPLIQSNESIETVLQTVEYDKAWYFGASSQEWKSYVRFKSYGGDLRHVNHTMGIWINVTEDCNLTVAGIVPAQTTIHLYEGWNLVSFPSFNSSYSMVDLKADIGAVRVEGFYSLPPHYLRILGDTEVLQAGYGYWVSVETYVVWTQGIE